MTFGLVVLIVVCAWSLFSIVASLSVGAMAKGRDAGLDRVGAPRVVARDVDTQAEAATRDRQLAS